MLTRDFGLTETQRDFRSLAAEFVDNEIVPHVRDWDRAERVDPDIVKRLGELGILGLTLPEEYGGVEADMLSYTLVTEELGRGDSSVRGIVSVSLGLVSKTIATHGTDEQKAEWLPRLAAGEALGCFALTEPGTGSDAGSVSTRAVRDGGDWVIDGAKIFITNGTVADVALVFARTGEKGLTAFLVPTDSPGFTATEIHGKLGLRGQATAELILEGVRVPDTARLGEEGRGLGIALGTLSRGRVSVAVAPSASPRAPSTPPSGTPGNAPSSASRSPRSSWSRSCWPTPRWTCARPGCSPTRWPAWRTPGRARRSTRRTPRSPSTTRARPQSASATTASRSSAATATSMSTRSASTSATPASSPSTRAPARSRS